MTLLKFTLLKEIYIYIEIILQVFICTWYYYIFKCKCAPVHLLCQVVSSAPVVFICTRHSLCVSLTYTVVAPPNGKIIFSCYRKSYCLKSLKCNSVLFLFLFFMIFFLIIQISFPLCNFPPPLLYCYRKLLLILKDTFRFKRNATVSDFLKFNLFGFI